MTPYFIEDSMPALFVSAKNRRTVVLGMCGLFTEDDLEANKTFGDEVVWARIIFASREKSAAYRVAVFALN